MSLFKKDWTVEEADRWTIHDALASLLGAISFVLITIGIVGAFLFQVWGFAAVVASLLCAWLMFKIIDPKMRAMSDGFEAQQDEYLDRLEKSVRWEESDGD